MPIECQAIGFWKSFDFGRHKFQFRRTNVYKCHKYRSPTQFHKGLMMAPVHPCFREVCALHPSLDGLGAQTLSGN